MSNHQSLEDIIARKAAVGSVALFDKAILNPEQAGKFIREIIEEQVILKEASVVTMRSHTKNLDRVAIDGRILHSGYTAAGATRAVDAAGWDTFQNQLVAQKLKTQAEIEDDALEDNIEGKAFANTLLELISGQIGYDMEVWSLFGDTTINFSTDDLLSTTDGFLKKSGQNVYDVDIATDGVEKLFDDMIEALPKKYIKNRGMLRFYVPYDYEKAYRDVLKERGTPLGDTNITGYGQLAYEGIPVVHVPALDDATAQALLGAGETPAIDVKPAMLSDPANLVFGIFRQIGVEPARDAEKELTKYVVTMRGDVHFTNELANVAAYPQLEEPEG
jgi:hypothetical protein